MTSNIRIEPTTLGRIRFGDLTPARQKFVRLCQLVNFGSIEDLLLQDGEPTGEKPPRVLVDEKLVSDELPRQELCLEDFFLSQEVWRLMKRFDAVGTGIIRRIEIRAGIPRRVIFDLPTTPKSGE